MVDHGADARLLVKCGAINGTYKIGGVYYMAADAVAALADERDAAIAARCVDAFEVWLGPLWRNNWDGPESESARKRILEGMPTLRGKNLACWCPVGSPCHADVLLRIANADQGDTP